MKNPFVLAVIGLVVGAVVGLATNVVRRTPSPLPVRMKATDGTQRPTRHPGLPASLTEEEHARSLPAKLEALHHPVRQSQLPPEAILAELRLRPGMTVVDIGAGGGQLSFPMARAVTPTGRVYATDVDDRIVPLLQARAKREGVATLTPVLVGPDFDAFYRDKQFDLAVMCSSFEYLRSPSDFFRQLRPTIRAGTGRVAILQARTVATYFASDFGETLRSEALLAEGVDSPLGRRVRAENLERHARRVPGAPVQPGVAAALAEDFNRLLDDPRLLTELAAFATVKNPRGRGLFVEQGFDDVTVVRWILHNFDRIGLWDEPKAELAPHERNALRTVNWIALLPYFSETLPREFFARGIYLSPKGITRRLEAEGYRFVRSVPILQAHDFLIFEADPRPR